MSVKIKNISVTGIRGVKDTVVLSADEKSVLLYGDNGAGKSSITDAVEWLYTDKISHLSSGEIDFKSALRNAYLGDDDISAAAIDYNLDILNAAKKLICKKGKLTAEFSELSAGAQKYYAASKNENLMLRYQSLREFVDQTKGDKLKYLSGIIGFSEVTKAKDVLKKVFGAVKTEIKAKNFEGQINTQKQTLIAKIGAVVSREENLFNRINEIINPLNTGITVKSIADIDTVLNHIKKPAHVDTKPAAELQFLESVSQMLSTLKRETEFIDAEYRKYYAEFNKIAGDVQAVMQTFLSELLKAGENVLAKKYHRENTCPLCLQSKNVSELAADIQKRLREIAESSRKKAAFDAAKQAIGNIAAERLRRLDAVLSGKQIDAPENQNIKQAVNALKVKISEYKKASDEKVTSGNKLPVNTELILSDDDFKVQEEIAARTAKIYAAFNDKKDNSMELYAGISAAHDAFLRIKQFESDKDKLEHQKNSLEIIYNEFVKRQKEGLENFINTFSESINVFYQYMNPDEQFYEIRIAPIGDDDELSGITVEYKYNDEWVSPPQKYFSESHLNCLGVAFFLASVIAFNKENKFIILDDVVSSFDSAHRKRFAELLFEKFADYQVILLTHESEWFNQIRKTAEEKGWLTGEIKREDGAVGSSLCGVSRAHK